MLVLLPFFLLGAVMGLSWWEERMLPSAERSLAAALMQSVQFPSPQDAELSAMADGLVPGLSYVGPAEPAELPVTAALSTADDRRPPVVHLLPRLRPSSRRRAHSPAVPSSR